MSKAVLISIRPQWCEKIFNGQKTIEVRKTRPKLETPFKCYIYCTQSGIKKFWTGPRYSYADDHSHNQFDRCGCSKVIGEFVCDRIYDIVPNGCEYIVPSTDKGTTNEIAKQSCLTFNDLRKYLGLHCGYGWHISNLKCYDEPKELSEFTAACRYKNDDGTCLPRRIACSFQRYDYNPDGSINIVECGNTIRRPPQSWGYVEELP